MSVFDLTSLNQILCHQCGGFCREPKAFMSEYAGKDSDLPALFCSDDCVREYDKLDRHRFTSARLTGIIQLRNLSNSLRVQNE